MKPQVEIVDKQPTEWTLKITVSPEKVNEVFQSVTGEVARAANIPGFRKGKAPMAMVEKNFAGRIYQSSLERVIQESLREAIIQEKINPIAYPEIDAEEGGHFHKGESFTYRAKVEVPPEVKLKTYKSLKVKVPRTKTSNDDVEKQLKMIQERMAEFKPVEGRVQAQKGDFVTIDYQGFAEDGTPVAKVSGKDLMVELGSGKTIPGFEDGIIGCELASSRELPLVFPNDYHDKDLAGKPVKFLINLKSIKMKSVPNLTDEWAEKLGGQFKSLLDLRSKIRTDLDAQNDQKFKDDLKAALRDQLVVANPFDVPRSMVNSQLEHLKENMRQRLQQQYVPHAKIDELMATEQKRFADMARDQVRAALLIHEIAKVEKFSVTEEDLNGHLKKWVSSSDEKIENIRARAEKEGWIDSLRQELLDDKVFAFLESHASVQEETATAPRS